MADLIFCQKLQKMAPALMHAPYPGPLGERIQTAISQEAWQLWLNHQTMLINEYRLSLMDLKARAFLKAEMEKFLFGTGSEKPAGFMPVGSLGESE